MAKNIKNLILFIPVVFVLFFGLKTQAVSNGGSLNFNVDSSYDVGGRSEVATVLVKTTAKIYFYIEKNWWDLQNSDKKDETLNNLGLLSQEFESSIYPKLTSAFGSEWRPGIDGEERITVLFHSMKQDVGGYFRSVDEYLKLQMPDSNEKEMLYLPIAEIDNSRLKTFLAHEFIHLITFNQKDRIFGVSEEVWLNEARAEYAITFLGYDLDYAGSNLQRRVQDFLERPNDSVTEWQNKKWDYGSVNIFTQYLVDHYGISILTDSLQTKLVGIPAINQALSKNGFTEDFSQIFTDWTIAAFVNNCSLGSGYCYLSENLTNLKVAPVLNFLPLSGKSFLSVSNVTKNWAGEWQRFIGGNSTLKLEFQGLAGLNFKVPCLVQDKNGNFKIQFLVLDKDQRGEIQVADFGTENKALIIIPSLQTKTSGFNGVELTYPFTFTVVAGNTVDETEIQNQLLAQIDFLQKEIAKIQAQIDAILGSKKASCSAISSNLFFGMRDSQVSCLQEFLKLQGVDVYPEGLVTGFFGSLTQQAVIRFQERYAADILAPIGLARGTGIVGPQTRAKINQLKSQ